MNNQRCAQDVDEVVDIMTMLIRAAVAAERERNQKIVIELIAAYPTDAFRTPTPAGAAKANELLKTQGMTVDQFSASASRHILNVALLKMLEVPDV